jgi:hypothetical protein
MAAWYGLLPMSEKLGAGTVVVVVEAVVVVVGDEVVVVVASVVVVVEEVVVDEDVVVAEAVAKVQVKSVPMVNVSEEFFTAALTVTE